MNPSQLLLDVTAFPGGLTGILIIAVVLVVGAGVAFIALKIFARTVKTALKLLLFGIVVLGLIVGAGAIYFFSGSDEPASKPTNSRRTR